MDINKELIEVKEQTEIVLSLLEQALEKTASATNWGLFDIFSGGMMSSLVKRGRMKESNQLMGKIEVALQKLQTEYGDIEMELPSKFNLDFTSGVLDVWFDNIFTDLSVQSSLKERKTQLEQLHDQVGELDRLLAVELSKSAK